MKSEIIDVKNKLTPRQDVHIRIVNHDLFRGYPQEMMSGGMKTVIFDEVHKVKNPESQISQVSQEWLTKQQVKRAILLSGTITLNNPAELYAPLVIVIGLRKGEFLPVTYKDFCARYCRRDKSRLVGREEKLQEINQYLEGFMLRRMKCEVELKLPPKVRNYQEKTELPQTTEKLRYCSFFTLTPSKS